MTAAEVGRLVRAGESLGVEFKGEERSPLNDRDIVQSVVCLANRGESEPGYLLVGVEDDGRITGARARHGTGTNTDVLAAMIAGRTRPAVATRVRTLTLRGQPVIVIEVPPQRQPIGTSEGLFLRRTLGGDGRPACVPMDSVEIQSLQVDRGLLDPSGRIVPDAGWSDLDPLEFERFRRSVRERRGRSDEALLDLPDLDLAKALNVVEANGDVREVRLAALLLFGKDEALRRHVPTHEVAFQVLRGLDVEVNDFFRWPLLRSVEEIESRIRARNREQELMVGVLRVGVPDYSERALREGLANALIHRDYQRLGAVHFQWHPERIEISNPGGFPDGVRLDNLLVTAPRPRNPLLADAFKRAGLVERTARGIDTMYFEQLRNGRAAPSYARSSAAGVVLVVPGGPADLDFVRMIVRRAQSGRNLELDDLLILSAVRRQADITPAEAARLLQKVPAEARDVLLRLNAAGLVDRRAAGRTARWALAPGARLELGDESAAEVR